MAEFSIKKASVLILLLCFLSSFLSSCNNNQIESIYDLSGKTVSYQKGSIQEDVLTNDEIFKDCTYSVSSTAGNCVADLLSDKTDAVALDYIVALKYASNHYELKLLDERLDIDSFGFAFNRDNASIRDTFNIEIAKLKANRTIASLVEKWVGDTEKTVISQDWKGKNGTLNCYVSADVAPICYQDEEGNFLGIDVELILLIAKRLDYHINFVNSDFDDLIISVASGEADFAASGITVTESRAKLVCFTDGYLETSTAFLVLNLDTATHNKGIVASIKDGFNASIVEGDNWKNIVSGLLITVTIILETCITGIVFGFYLFFAVYFFGKIPKKIITFTVDKFVFLPLSTWLLICYYLIFPVRSSEGYFVAIFGLTVTFGFTTFRSLYGAYNSISKGEKEACYTMGYSNAKALFKIYMPQILSKFFYSLSIDIVYHVRDTSLVGYVAVQDISEIASAISSETSEPFFPIILTAIAYISLCVIASVSAHTFQKKLFPVCPDQMRITARAKKGAENDKT